MLRAQDNALRGAVAGHDVTKIEQQRARVAELLEGAVRQARRQDRLVNDLVDTTRA
jgi:hypothetical protein